MKNQNTANSIMASMDQILKDPEYNRMFSPSDVLEKLAFTRVADEDKPTELEVEFAVEIDKQELTATADNERASCIMCGKKRPGWTEAMGVCKCGAQNGCNPMEGCKEDCDCGCKVKQAEVVMDNLVKSAFNSLMSASTDLEDAGFEELSATALVLINDLIVEAKAKKNKKDDKDKMKADKEKAKAKAEAEKAKALKAKEKAKAEKDKNDAKDKAFAAKMKAAKEKAAKEKADKAKKK